MKNKFLALILLCAFYSLNGQEKTDTNPYQKNNEIKINVILPLFGAVEGGYERFLNKNSSLGISGFIVFDNKKEDDMNFYISPYYRYYFGKKYASGFFAEGFGMFTSIDGKKIYSSNKLTFTEGKNVYDLALGAGLGYKLVTKQGLVFEANTAYGRLVFNADKTDHNQVIKLGFSVGYQF